MRPTHHRQRRCTIGLVPIRRSAQAREALGDGHEVPPKNGRRPCTYKTGFFGRSPPPVSSNVASAFAANPLKRMNWSTVRRGVEQEQVL